MIEAQRTESTQSTAAKVLSTKQSTKHRVQSMEQCTKAQSKLCMRDGIQQLGCVMCRVESQKIDTETGITESVESANLQEKCDQNSVRKDLRVGLPRHSFMFPCFIFTYSNQPHKSLFSASLHKYSNMKVIPTYELMLFVTFGCIGLSVSSIPHRVLSEYHITSALRSASIPATLPFCPCIPLVQSGLPHRAAACIPHVLLSCRHPPSCQIHRCSRCPCPPGPAHRLQARSHWTQGLGQLLLSTQHLRGKPQRDQILNFGKTRVGSHQKRH